MSIKAHFIKYKSIQGNNCCHVTMERNAKHTTCVTRNIVEHLTSTEYQVFWIDHYSEPLDTLYLAYKWRDANGQQKYGS